MPHRFDASPLYQTFEELERDELRRADAMGGRIEDLFDGMFSDDPHPSADPARWSSGRGAFDRDANDADDEE